MVADFKRVLKYIIVANFVREITIPHFTKITISQILWDILYYNTRTLISHCCKFHEILQYLISWDISPKPQYPMVEDFVRYNTRTLISHGCKFHEILQYLISWDISSKPQYLMVEDFVRYNTRTLISHGCRFHEICITISHGCKFCEIKHLNINILWLQISWDISSL